MFKFDQIRIILTKTRTNLWFLTKKFELIIKNQECINDKKSLLFYIGPNKHSLILFKMNAFELFNIHFSFYHWKHVNIDKFVKKLSFDNNLAKIVRLCYSQTPSYELKSGFLSKLIIILFRYQSELFCSKSQIRKCFCPNEPNLVKFEQKLTILEYTTKYTKLNRHPVGCCLN